MSPLVLPKFLLRVVAFIRLEYLLSMDTVMSMNKIVKLFKFKRKNHF